jgi:hypothetical protein
MPCTRVEHFQLLEAERALEPRRLVERDQSGFTKKRSAPAHWVEERHARVPLREPQYARREIFPKRGIAGRRAIAALEQCFARRVQIERDVCFREKGLNSSIGRACIDIGPFARRFSKGVADRILDPQRHEIEAFNGRADRGHVHADRTIH